MSLKALYDKIRSTAIELNGTDYGIVLPEGHRSAKAMFVGYQPAKDDMRRAFTGRHNKIVRDILAEIQEPLSNVHLTYCCKQRINPDRGDSQYMRWVDVLAREIEIVNPDHVVLMGTLAATAVLGTNVIPGGVAGKYRHIRFRHNDGTPPDFSVTYEPEYVMACHGEPNCLDLRDRFVLDLKAATRPMQYLAAYQTMGVLTHASPAA